MKFCACIDAIFTELPFYDRFNAAKFAGFESVEFWSRDNKNPDKIREVAQSAGITISGFNGDGPFSLIDPSQKEQYLEYLLSSVDFAKKVGAISLTIHSNALGVGGVVINHYNELSDNIKICSMYEMLKECACISESSGVNMNLEALNTTTDHVGNFLNSTRMGAEMTRLIKCNRLKILFDIYHMQLNEGSISYNIKLFIDQIGHIHVADVPGRHEPGTGEINYKNVFDLLKNLEYKHRIGFELFPKKDSATAVNAIMALK